MSKVIGLYGEQSMITMIYHISAQQLCR